MSDNSNSKLDEPASMSSGNRIPDTFAASRHVKTLSLLHAVFEGQVRILSRLENRPAPEIRAELNEVRSKYAEREMRHLKRYVRHAKDRSEA